ncbi:hypothetical protein SAMN05661091_4144 [Paenibacillus uliginis N3/975]|uniref:Uncharacterized protein n=1 Tax=Paenibacillus uliginis N3/975 TaxID=1313296 RepID=A0A1X7HKV7_9BACL|nr:hypothetical protein [Paenibacillus uliginis]SMF88155.1 hypothetical protein SAMN05661091_4144 [Paenibacillus uliginis N3/975]
MATKKNQGQDQERQEIQPLTRTSEAPQEPKVEVAAEPEQLIYIGPSIRMNGVGIRTNQVFIGGHPEYFKALYAEYPLIKNLFVPVDQLQESLKQIKQTGTALNTALQSLKGV